MSKVRSSGTKLENEFAEALLKLTKKRFRRNAKGILGRPDFAFDKDRACIFLDSDFWHGWKLGAWQYKLKTDFWREKIERNKRRDRFVTRKLRADGWRVLRIWEHDLKLKNREKTLKRVKKFMHAAPKAPTSTGVVGGRSQIKGKGLFATRRFRSGERIMRMSGKKASERQVDRLIAKGALRLDDPFEIGQGYYVVLDPLPLLANHSCAPNAGIRGVDELVALRAIRNGEEITYDYATMVGDSAPYEEDWFMRCRCGASNCRKIIGNWRTIPASRLRTYLRKDALPRFIKRLAMRGTV